MIPAEVDVARPVVEWLADLRYDVYQEVAGYYGVADIVATRGPLIWVVEVKRTFSLPLLEQAHRWIGSAHRVSIAVPKLPSRAHDVAMRVLESFGIGVFLVTDGHVAHRGTPLHRAVKTDVWNLCDEQRDYVPAGSCGGGYWSEFKRTAKDARRYVDEHPGCTLRELVDGIAHHYSSDKTARAHLPRYIRDGIIEGIRVEETRPLRLWPESVQS